jgi:hypothetical protein
MTTWMEGRRPAGAGRFVPARAGRRIVLLLCGALLAGVAAWSLFPGAASAQLLTEEDLALIPAGSQPIKFSHKVHAGDNMVQCEYCHVYARRSRVAGIPAVAICMGCHKFVNPALSEVQKVAKFWDAQEPIPWVKISDIPDFVRFNHAQHVNAKNEVYPKGVPCQTCHGQVQTMNVVQKADPNFGLMGWCLNCHLTVPGTLEQKRGTPEALGSMRLLHSKHPAGNYVRPKLTDCLTCHY